MAVSSSFNHCLDNVKHLDIIKDQLNSANNIQDSIAHMAASSFNHCLDNVDHLFMRTEAVIKAAMPSIVQG